MKFRHLALSFACALGLPMFAPAASAATQESEQTVPAITEVRLVSHVNANLLPPIRTLANGDQVVLTDLPEVVNIEAVSEDPSRTGSVKFQLDGPRQLHRTENTPIYTLADAFVNFNLAQQGLPEGDYVLQVTPFAGSNATGTAGETVVTRFSVHETQPLPVAKVPAITSVRLVEILAKSEYGSLKTLADGDQLVLAELPGLLNFEAVSADPANTGSVEFVLQGPKELRRFENVAIYTMVDSHYNIDTRANDLPVGDYVLTVTPYSGANLSGDAGKSETVTFSVHAETVADLPAISAVQILDYASEDKRVVRSLADGDVIALADLPQLMNIEAVPADAEKVGSVDFVLQGPLDLARFENTAIYTMANSYYNIDTTANGLPEGNYSLAITPYSGSDLTGTAGKTQLVKFTVAAQPQQPSSPEKTQPVPSNVPPIAGVQLLGMVAPGQFDVMNQLVDGDVLDLGQLPAVINFEAVSADESKTGSVAIELSGPVSLSRFENNAIYTIADTAYNFNLTEQGLPAGKYTLRLTPFAGPNATGEVGYATVTRFSVTGKVAAPVRSQPLAKDDSYYGSENNTLRVNAGSGLLSNDLAEALDSAHVRLVTDAQHGTVSLASDGSFSYKPDYQFAGTDAFQYALIDEYGAESLASVSLNIAQAETANLGFTPIVASDDTRTVYVSSSEGLDANDGLSIHSPVKTLNKAFSLVRSGYPDHVLLKRGDVWTDENLNNAKSGRSEAEPAVVAFYGDRGDRPKLKTSSTSMSSKKLYHAHIMGLEIEAYKLNPADRAFDGVTSANIRLVGDFRNVLFEDMKLRFVEFIIQGYQGVARDFRIRRSMILDKYSPNTSYNRDSRPSGIYTDNGNGLTIEDNLWDHNGWNAEVTGAGANMYNHNMYISERNNVGNNIVVRNNIVTRGSALGIHGRPGGLYENNFFGRNAIGLQMGYKSGPALSAGTFAYARNNVITEGLNMNRGVNSCSGTNICTKAIWGLHVENLGEADVRVEGNIVSNRLFEHNGYVTGIQQDSAAKYSDNIIYRWENETQATDKRYPDPSRTLADYNASLGGERSFEAFIEAARNRGLQEWDERYSADAVNDYIRAGFGR